MNVQQPSEKAEHPLPGRVCPTPDNPTTGKITPFQSADRFTHFATGNPVYSPIGIALPSPHERTSTLSQKLLRGLSSSKVTPRIFPRNLADTDKDQKDLRFGSPELTSRFQSPGTASKLPFSLPRQVKQLTANPFVLGLPLF